MSGHAAWNLPCLYLRNGLALTKGERRHSRRAVRQSYSGPCNEMINKRDIEIEHQQSGDLPCEEKEDDATESCEEGSPVQKNEPPG